MKIVQRTNTTVDEIISKYSAHPSVQKFKREFSSDKKFEIAYGNDKDINQIIKSYKKFQVGFLLSLLKCRLDIINCHITNIVNKDGIRTIAPEEDFPPVRVRVSFRVGCSFPRRQLPENQ